jgi:hypothetical protein
MLRLDKNESLGGADSLFFEIDEEWGLKLFMSPLMRDRNFDRHVEFQEHAPKVGGKTMAVVDGKQMWGFYVEIVIPNDYVDDYDKRCENQFALKSYFTYLGVYDYRIRDMHNGNIGMTKCGNPVMLDFSRCVDEDGFQYHERSGRQLVWGKKNGQSREIELIDRGTNWRWKDEN